MAVYWIGANGNAYLKGESGVKDLGRVTKDYGNGFDAQFGSAQGTRIDDPNPPKQTAPTGGGGTTAPTYEDTSALRAAAQASLGSLGTVQQNRYGTEDANLNNLLSRYDTERLGEQGKYNDQVTDNEQSLASNQQAAMIAAAQGGRGLRATLAAMGALGGTGTLLADRAITDSANKDLGGAADSFETNAKTLQTAWGDFDKLDKERRETAQNTRLENRQSIDADILTTRQKLLQDMASYWEKAGNTGEYNNFMSQATALTPEIAGKSKSMSKYTPVQGSYNPADLSSYLAGNRDMTVGREAGGAAAAPALNNPLYALSQKKDKELV